MFADGRPRGTYLRLPWQHLGNIGEVLRCAQYSMAPESRTQSLFKDYFGALCSRISRQTLLSQMIRRRCMPSSRQVPRRGQLRFRGLSETRSMVGLRGFSPEPMFSMAFVSKLRTCLLWRQIYFRLQMLQEIKQELTWVAQLPFRLRII